MPGKFRAGFLLLFFLFALQFFSPAGAFSINSGYYVGNDQARSITGVGFRPDLIIIKADSLIGYPVFATSAMGTNSTAYLGVPDGNFSGGITSFDSDGFSIGTDNNVNVTAATYYGYRYTWIAVGGSGDGTFKVGSYTGNSADSRNITGVGFQPGFVWIKRDGASNGVFYSSSMPADSTEFFRAVAGTPAADRIQSLNADGFQVGTQAEVNLAGSTYYYVAFKAVANSCAVGTYAGDGNDNRSITGVGFQPDFVLAKQSGATNHAVLRDRNQYGDQTHLCTNANDATNYIQTLEADGFQVGTDATVNAAASTYYYLALDGVPAASYSGNYTFKSGSYTGNGSSQSITGLGFRPNLVIIKEDIARGAVFTTSTMPPDSTAYLTTAAANFIGGISSLDTDGFSIGSSAFVNSASQTYHWYAFGNANCSNFIVGAYSGNGEDNRNVPGLGINPDLLVVKGSLGAYNAFWRSASITGDNSAYFSATADVADRIQTLMPGGFQIGSDVEINRDTYVYHYFAFAESTNYFDVGTYTGDGNDNRSVTGLAGRPVYLWIKAPGAVEGVQRGLNLTGDSTQFFTSANAANRIQSLDQNGFGLGSGAEVNTAGTTYRYAAFLGVPTKVGFTVQPTTTTAGTAISPEVVAAIQDQFGQTVNYDSSTSVTLSISTNPGSATLSGTLSATVSGGLATFEGINLNKSGTGYVLAAAASGYTTGTSSTFNITPAAQNTLAFLVQPSTTEVNRTMRPSVEVAVRDSYGNTRTSDNTTLITLAIGNNPANGTLAGTLTKTASAGVVSFNDLSINWRGSGYTLRASAPYISAATSEGFDLTAEAVAPTILSYSPTNETSGVSLESKVAFNFSEAMDQSSVQNNFSLAAIRNNLGTSIETTVTGTFSWESASAVKFTPTSNLAYAYVYRAKVTAEARDLVGNAITNPITATFTTIATVGSISTTVGDDGKTEISLPANSLQQAFYVRISTSPETSPIFANPAGISAANAKVALEGDSFKFTIAGSFREFAIFDNAGNRLTSQLSGEAAISMPYTDVNNDGYVDGTSPPVSASALNICRLDETNGLWVIYPESIVDTSAKTVSVKVKSLSVFGLMARAQNTVADVYCFPNPFRPADGHTTITFANLASTCTIKIFTLSGQPVITLLENDGNRQYTWNVNNGGGEALVSGLYLYLVESSGDKKTGKFVVIK